MELELSELECRYEGLRIAEGSRHRRLVASLLAHGQQHPVLVVAGEPEGRYVLIDGYARVRALRSLSQDVVRACVLELTESDALAFTLALPQAQARTALEEGWLVRELVESHSRSLPEVAVLLDRSVSWVSRRLGLVRVLPESVQSVVQRGALCPQAATRVLVPLARANAGDCEKLVAALGPEGASVRDLESLYLAYKRGDEGQRARLIGEPRLFLRAFAESTAPLPSPGGEPTESAVTKDLEQLVTLSRRVRRRARSGELGRLGVWERQVASGLWREARLVLRSLLRVMEKDVENDRSGDADGDPALAPRGSGAAADCQAGGRQSEQRA